jgi:transcriptional regulator with XRE-family HTH domain
VVHDKTRHPVSVEVLRLLREERERRGLSKYFVAEKSGVSQQMIGYVERGMKSPSFETVVRIAEGIGVDLADVVKRASQHVSKSKPRTAKKPTS